MCHTLRVSSEHKLKITMLHALHKRDVYFVVVVIAQNQYILACFRTLLESKLGWVAFYSVTFELKCLDETAKDYRQTTALISHDLTGNMYISFVVLSHI